MSQPFRYLTRLIVGMGALALTGLGGAAFASVGPPDPTAAPTGQPQLVSVAHTVSGSGSQVTPVQPSYRVGAPISYPSDWQVYRAGERGDVPTQALPKDWSGYRAGER